MKRFFLSLLASVCFASPVQAITSIQEVSAPNGARAWLMEDHALPIVTLRIDMEGSGSASDPKDKEGLANLAAHLLDEGAGNMDSLAFNKAMEGHAIHFNAEVDEDTLTVGVETLSEFKSNAFDLLALALNKPRFDNGAVERIRTDLVTDIKQMEENPSYVASLKWKGLAFSGHPYAQPKQGTPESLAHVKREDLLKYGAERIVCAPHRIEIVGDMTSSEVSDLLTKLFPATHCNTTQAEIADVKVADGGAPIRVKLDIPQTVIQASLPSLMRDDPHYYAMVVLDQVFGGGTLTARLGEEIREKRGLAYYADSDLETMDHSAYMSIRFATRNEQADEAVDVFTKEIDKMRAKGITAAELERAKRYLTGSFALQLDSQASIAAYMSGMQHYKLGIDYLTKRNSKINAVTLDEVNALAKNIFLHKPLIIMVGNTPTKNDQKKDQ